MLNDFAEVIHHSFNHPKLASVLIFYRVAVLVKHDFASGGLYFYECRVASLFAGEQNVVILHRESVCVFVLNLEALFIQLEILFDVVWANLAELLNLSPIFNGVKVFLLD